MKLESEFKVKSKSTALACFITVFSVSTGIYKPSSSQEFIKSQSGNIEPRTAINYNFLTKIGAVEHDDDDIGRKKSR
jgi:hypothetical protein